jgi:threonyl-tRNA synthetase
LARQNSPYVRKDVSKADAIAYFTEKQDEYKLDLLEGFEDGKITFYNKVNLPICAVDRTFQYTGFIKAA